MSTEIKDLQINPDIHNPSLGDFRVGVGISNKNRELFYDESYFTLNFYQGIYNRDGLVVDQYEQVLEKTTCNQSDIERVTLSLNGDSSAVF